MKIVKLLGLGIKHFKGIDDFSVEFGARTQIKGENGSGKTTVYDAFLWLRAGKDSDGRSDFSVRPLDRKNKPVLGLTVSVSAKLDINGQIHIYRKDQVERLSGKVKKIVKGFTNKFWIDEVPMPEKDFVKKIVEIAQEDIFKVLTDLRHFCGNLHWKDQRSILLDIAGDTGGVEGFDELLDKLNGRTILQYEAVLKERKKLLKDELDKLPERIDEVHQGMVDATDTMILEASRGGLKEKIRAVENQRKVLLGSEKDRQAKIEQINKLKGKLGDRELALKSDTSAVKVHLDEKAEIEKAYAEAQKKATEIDTTLQAKLMAGVTQDKLLEDANKGLVILREKKTEITSRPIENVCYACKQPLPANKTQEGESKRQAELDEINTQGKAKSAEVQLLTGNIESLNIEIQTLQQRLKDANTNLATAEEFKEGRFAELDDLIAKNPTPDPEKDDAWKKIKFEIGLLHVKDSVSEKLAEIEIELTGKREELTKLNDALAQKDRQVQDKSRIAELETQQKDKTQQLLDAEKELNTIQNYKTEESKKVEESVNRMFKYTKFKLFKDLLDGETETKDWCVATLDGTPYPDMSYGERIRVGIDIINVLSKHYDTVVPLFVDNSESLTFLIEAESQVIELCAVPEMKELTIEKEANNG